MIDTQLMERYLDRVMLVADRRGDDAKEVRQELADHLYAKMEALMGEGMSKENAIMIALRESGKPAIIGYRLREPWRLIDVRAHGTARGIIAIGPKAVGVVAFGGYAVGIVAMGGIGIGVISIGFLALGCIAFGTLGVGGYALAAMAFGLIAYGGLSVGLFAGGDKTLGWLGDLSQQLPPILQRGDIPSLSNLFIPLFALYGVLVVTAFIIQLRELRRLRTLSDDQWLWK